MTNPKHWTCEACAAENPVAFAFCPACSAARPDGVVIDAIFAPPPGWEERGDDWRDLVMECDGLTTEQLQRLGLVRIDHVPDGDPDSLPALSPAFRTFAIQMRDEPAAGAAWDHMRVLPRDAEGEIDWKYAGHLMQLQVPLVRFVIHYCVGAVPDIENTLRRMINEWYGLAADLGLTDEESG